jgi:alkyl sulfatase BDS1-like metallo-beta-lactamase superfamily hydrolase
MLDEFTCEFLKASGSEAPAKMHFHGKELKALAEALSGFWTIFSEEQSQSEERRL